MAKKKENRVEADEIVIGETKIKAKVDRCKIPITKYFQLYGSSINKYTKAYMEGRFRAILKESDEWKKELEDIGGSK